MDSGNSGSLQSSSGGEEEYDSRAESISTFLNHHPSTARAGGGHLHHHPPPPHLSQLAQQHHQPSMFDPFSNYFDPLSSSSSSSSRSSLAPFTASSSNPNSLLNLDMVWSKGLRSGPNCTDLGGLFIASSSSPSAASSSSTQQLFTNHGALHNRTAAAAASTFQAAAGLNIPQGTAESAAAARASVSGFNIDQANIIISSNNNNNSGNSLNMARNPKKRSRASRRAPTTVLTTDTTNFRAMVQEFTGIPAPPFTSSPFPRTRLDLFGTSGSSLRSTPTHLDSSQPSYLLRPFAQKLNPIPFVSPPSSAASSSSFSSSSMIDAIASTTATNITSRSATAASNNNHSHSNSTSINYQLPSDLGGLLKQQQPQNLLSINMHSPILNPQSFLNPPPKYPLNAPILETKPQGSLDIIPSNDSHLKIGVLDELGLSPSAGGVHHHLNASLGGLQNIVSSDAATLPIRSDHQNNPAAWPPSSTDGAGSNENDQVLLRSISSGTGNYNSSQRVVNTNGKVMNNFMPSPSSSDFHHHHHQNHRDIKGQAAAENVTTRSEGMVESWICSSD